MDIHTCSGIECIAVEDRWVLGFLSKRLTIRTKPKVLYTYKSISYYEQNGATVDV